MRHVRSLRSALTSIAVFSVCLAPALGATWNPAVEISQNKTTKSATLDGSLGGGAHIKWTEEKPNNDWKIMYMNVDADGNHGAIKLVYDSTGLVANGEIKQAGNGDLWVSYEDWTSSTRGWAARSTNGGTSWTKYALGGEKFPILSRNGLTGAGMMFHVYVSSLDELHYRIWNGSSWASTQAVPGTIVEAEFWVSASAWSPNNGHVWRPYGRQSGGTNVFSKTFNGATWSSETQVSQTNGFFAWPDVAVNENGHALVVWERDASVRGRLYKPSTGWGTEVVIASNARAADVTYIPGEDDFYVAWQQPASPQKILGTRMTNGSPTTQDTISVGLNTSFSGDPDISADEYGRLHCVLEHWVDNRPEVYYTSSDEFYSPPTPPPTPDPVKNDYNDGDAKSDIAIISTGSAWTWWIKTSSSGFQNYVSHNWGSSTFNDVAVTGDFDGDGKADPTVYRPGSQSTFYALKSTTGYTGNLAVNWGSSSVNDVPVAGDFDGDQQTDIAVYRPGSSAAWHIKTSTSNYASHVSYTHGTTGDVPITGDFDGDGISDIAVYRSASSSSWRIKTSSSNFANTVVHNWGSSSLGDVPVSGDFDGDGKTDPTVYRPGSQSVWWVLKSSTNYTTWVGHNWGSSSLNDQPVTGDYDGDGQTDITVYRPSAASEWWVLTSTSGYASNFSVQWGATGMTVAGQAGQQPQH